MSSEVRLEDGSTAPISTVSSGTGYRYMRDSDGNEFLASPLRAPMGARSVDGRSADGSNRFIAITP